MERVDNINFGGYKIYQDDEGFLYGTDAVILSCFTARYAKKGENSIDLGTNTGIVPTIVLSKRKEFNFVGIEVQKESFNLAIKGAKENNLENKLKFIYSDILDLENKVQWNAFDLVTCNPPYIEKGNALDSNNEKKLIARTETTAKLEDFIKVSANLLKEKGELYMVNRPYRLVDILFIARKYRLEAKRIQFVAPRKGENPNLVLMSFTKGAGKEVIILPEIAVREKEDYTSEFKMNYRDF